MLIVSCKGDSVYYRRRTLGYTIFLRYRYYFYLEILFKIFFNLVFKTYSTYKDFWSILKKLFQRYYTIYLDQENVDVHQILVCSKANDDFVPGGFAFVVYDYLIWYVANYHWTTEYAACF